MKVNEYYELIEDEDLQVTESYHSMILVCPACKALFGMKACGGRTLFEWFGYHPTDGNLMVLTPEGKAENSLKVMKCRCDTDITRVKTKEQLDAILL